MMQMSQITQFNIDQFWNELILFGFQDANAQYVPSLFKLCAI